MVVVVAAATYAAPRILRPSIYDLWINGLWWDVWLLAGGVVFGTAAAKGVHPHDIVRRHAAPLSFPGTFSFVAVSAPLIITNMGPGRAHALRAGLPRVHVAGGRARESLRFSPRDPIPDFALLCALAVWGAVLVIVVGLIADGIVSRLDPRVRSSHGQAW